MHTLRLFLLLISSSLAADETTRAQYFELLKERPYLIKQLGTFSKGEIEIILDNDRMAAIEQATGRKVGLISEDKYWIWVNDACQFPNGSEGVYGRILKKNGQEAITGVAVLPILESGSIALNCNFRHATRSWEVELPRGAIESGELPEEAAKREVLEETGFLVENLYKLGEIPPDSGLTETIAAIFMAKIVKQQTAQPEESEAIEEILTMSLADIKKAFLKGFIIRTIRGEKIKVFFRDPFLAYALLLYDIHLNQGV